MSRLKLSVATTDYDHFRDFRLGTVQAEGIDTIWSLLGHHEMFARFTFDREWDAAELSFAKFTAQVTREGLRHHRPAGGVLAAVPLLVVLRQQEEQDQNREGPQGQDHRLAGMGAHRRGLHARLAQRRARRRAEGHQLGARPAPTRPAASRRSS